MRNAGGYICVMAAALLWASSGTAGKALFEGGMTPFELVQMRQERDEMIPAMIRARKEAA
ncbi:MAG: hypothetical protein AB1512_13735 [Thermodesulfobacteriota bacterium]